MALGDETVVESNRSRGGCSRRSALARLRSRRIGIAEPEHVTALRNFSPQLRVIGEVKKSRHKPRKIGVAGNGNPFLPGRRTPQAGYFLRQHFAYDRADLLGCGHRLRSSLPQSILGGIAGVAHLRFRTSEIDPSGCTDHSIVDDLHIRRLLRGVGCKNRI